MREQVIAAVLSLTLLATIGTPLVLSRGKMHVTPAPGGVASSDAQLALCLGFKEEQVSLGKAAGDCPSGYAFYGADDPAGKSGPAEHISVSGSCCPLPAADILTDEHSYAKSVCPADSIATGTKTVGRYPETITEMRCTKINTKRYQLGEAQESLYWGDGAAGWQGSKWIRWKEIPAAIRYGQGREGSESWDVDGCIGYPWGSLLAEKDTKYCAGFKFRQLRFAGLPGDPARGTPVQMFPDCLDVDDIASADKAACRRAG